MGRLTTDKSVEDMGMYEMAHNCCYGKEESARYRDYVKDIDARQFTRDIYYSYTGQKLPENEDEFDECMLDMLMYDTAEIEGLIAYFYRNLWAMANLRERLKEYEDIIDAPEKLKVIDELYLEKCEEIKKVKDKMKVACDIDEMVKELGATMGNGSGFEQGFQYALEEVKNYGKAPMHIEVT